MQFIETIVMQCPKINACSCIWLPKPMLLIVYYTSEKVESSELIDFLKSKLHESSLPDRVIRVKNLPINEHGKISKQILIKLYESSSNASGYKDTFKTAFMKELRSSLNLNVTYNEIKDKDFFSIGGTSFLAVTLCNRLAIEYSDVAKHMLPNLLSHKYTIDKIIRMAQKVKLSSNHSSKVGRRKRSRTSLEIDSYTESEICKRSTTNLKYFITLSMIWSYDTGKCVDASPIVFESNGKPFVTVGSHSGQIVSNDAITGKLMGTLNMKSRVEASVYCYVNELGEPCGIVGTYDGTVICYSLESCFKIWEVNISSMIKSRAVCYHGILYVASYDGNIRCIKIKDGQIISIISITDQAISADLVLAKEYILVGTLSGSCASIHTATNSIIWCETLSSPVFANPTLYNDDKYVIFAEVNGVIYCRSIEKGEKIWKYNGAKGNIFSSTHIKQKGINKWQMLFGCHDEKIYCVNINNHQTSLAWILEMYSPVYSTPNSINENYIVAISTKGRLVIVNSENGKLVHEYMFPGEVFSSPAVYKDYLFIGCRNDNLYALKYCL